MERNIHPDLQINENDLDGEWLRQAGLYDYWCEQWAIALKEKDEIWLEKKILKATLFKEARINLTENGKTPSDNRCDVEVHADPRYKDVSLRLINLEEKVNKLDGRKWAFEQKKKSLEQLSDSADRRKNMTDGYAGVRKDANDYKTEAVERRNLESEEIDRAHRARINRG